MRGLMSDLIGKCENAPIFPSVENCLGFRVRLSFCGQATMSASCLKTVFLITQAHHSIPYKESIAITILEMLAGIIKNLFRESKTFILFWEGP